MEKKYSLEDVVKSTFEAIKQRGKYLAYIIRELDVAGFKDFDDTIKQAIFKFGKEKSAAWGSLGAKDFMKHMISDDIIAESFGVNEIGESTNKRTEFTFGRCPLEEGWKEMGLSDEERYRLCSLASEHDFGIVDNDELLELEMPEAIGRGNPVCRLIITQKK